MKLGCLVRVREGCGHLSGGIYTYETQGLGGPEQDVKFLFSNRDVGIILQLSFTEHFENIEYTPVAKVLTTGGVGWVPRDYIQEVR